MSAGDPGFAVLMWLTMLSGFNIWFLHLIGGAIFSYGLSTFCLREPHPWLTLTVAVPYLIIVVAMGYDRQAVAIGFVMLAMVATPIIAAAPVRDVDGVGDRDACDRAVADAYFCLYDQDQQALVDRHRRVSVFAIGYYYPSPAEGRCRRSRAT